MGSPEERILRFLRTRGHAPAAERAVARFSALGEHGALWLALGAAGAAIDRARSERWLGGVATVLGAYGLNTALKLAVGRRRPTLSGLPPLASTPTQLSFPSAHTATAFAGAAAYSRLGLPRWPLYTVASATALSRLYLGLHYPSDVLAGAMLGHAVAALAERSRPEADPAGLHAVQGNSANGASSAAGDPGEQGMKGWSATPGAMRDGGRDGGSAGSGPR